MPDFHYQPLFELGHPEVTWRRIPGDFVKTERFGDRTLLRVDPEALTLLAAAAMRDIAHLFRPGHLAQLRKILDDPEASRERPLRRARAAEEREHRGGHACCRRARTPAPRS